MIYPAQFAPLAYSMPGMLSCPDRPAAYVPVWVRSPLCPPDVALGYLLSELYPGGLVS